MKKKEWLFLGILGIISLTACRAKTEVDNGREQETGRYSIATSGIEVEVPKEKEIVDDFTQFQEVLAKQTYVFETDMQNQYDSSSRFDDCVEMENSFVFLKFGKLYRFDKEKKIYSIACNDPACSHNTESDCSANMAECMAIEYYDGYLYALMVEMSGDGISHLYLYRMDEYGKNREKICNIASVADVPDKNTNVFTVWTARIHRGYLYYMYSYGDGDEGDEFYVNGSNVLYRISLDGESARETIMKREVGEIIPDLYLKASGSYVYFLHGKHREQGNTTQLLRFNTESGKVEMSKKWEDIDDFVLIGEEPVYLKKGNNDYLRYDIKNDEESTLVKNESEESGMVCGYPSTDGKYLYGYWFSSEENGEKALQKVYTLDGTYLTEYECSVIQKEDLELEYHVGNRNFDFMISLNGENFGYIDKSDIMNVTFRRLQ